MQIKLASPLYIQAVENYLNAADNVVVVLVSEQLTVIEHNNAFHRALRGRTDLIGKNIMDFLSAESSARRLFDHPHSVQPQRLTFTASDKTFFYMDCVIYPADDGYLLIGSHHLAAEHKIIESMTRLSNELINKTRELYSKNIAMENAETTIRGLLAEKDITLQEVHHRIKNNMSIVAALLSLQADRLENSVAVAALNDSRARVLSMMVLYDKLYRSQSFLEISFKDYLTKLISEIMASFTNRDRVHIELHLADFSIKTKILSHLGIIINEIITNAMKHAFTGRTTGLISVTASLADKYLLLVIEDDGPGIPEAVNLGASGGFGLQLITLLTKQLPGTIKLERQQGTRFTFELEL